RGPGSKKAAVERREARLLDRKRRQHASQACWVTSPVTRGASHAPAFLGAPLPFYGERGLSAKAARGRRIRRPRARTRRENEIACLKYHRRGNRCPQAPALPLQRAHV